MPRKFERNCLLESLSYGTFEASIDARLKYENGAFVQLTEIQFHIAIIKLREVHLKYTLEVHLKHN